MGQDKAVANLTPHLRLRGFSISRFNRLSAVPGENVAVPYFMARSTSSITSIAFTFSSIPFAFKPSSIMVMQ